MASRSPQLEIQFVNFPDYDVSNTVNFKLASQSW